MIKTDPDIFNEELSTDKKGELTSFDRHNQILSPFYPAVVI